MSIGMVGLGRMGASVAARLLQAGHPVVAFDRSAEKRRAEADRLVAEVAEVPGGWQRPIDPRKAR